MHSDIHTNQNNGVSHYSNQPTLFIPVGNMWISVSRVQFVCSDVCKRNLCWKVLIRMRSIECEFISVDFFPARSADCAAVPSPAWVYKLLVSDKLFISRTCVTVLRNTLRLCMYFCICMQKCLISFSSKMCYNFPIACRSLPVRCVSRQWKLLSKVKQIYF